MYSLLLISAVIVGFILWFWAIVDIVKAPHNSQSLKITWLLIILLFPIVGSIFYFQMGKKLILKEPRKFQPNFNSSNK